MRRPKKLQVVAGRRVRFRYDKILGSVLFSSTFKKEVERSQGKTLRIWKIWCDEVDQRLKKFDE